MNKHNPILLSFILFSFISLYPIDSSGATAPEIQGSDQFIDQVQKALLLLKERDVEAYAIVTTYIGRIQQNKLSGMDAAATPPTYYISDITAFASVTWCAATIAHDSFHSKLYHDYLKAHDGPVPSTIYKGREVERQCVKHQLAVMERIGAPAEEIFNAMQSEDGNFVDENGNMDYSNPW
jgi:hypothetical protein